MNTKHTLENGRSMVEMLGTLAIIGVLSVGAIAGYSYGMNKYRANQTIHDISLRTVDLMTQASQGRTELSLAEWDKETTIYDFANPAYVEGENLIAFDIGTTKKIPQSVCEMLFDGLSNTAVQIDINGTTSTSNDSCGKNNTMTFYFAEGSNASGGTTGEQCGSSVCGTCQKCENETCMPVSDYEAKCTVDGQSGWCVGETCQAETCNCDKGYYCADKNNSGGSCYNPTPSDNCVEAEPQFRTVKIADTTYYISNDPMSWWDAVSACKALGNKQLLSPSDLVDGFDETNSSSQDLVNSTLGDALYEKGWNSSGYPEIWSNVLHVSCYASYVFLDRGDVNGGYERNTVYPYAVCR